MPGPDIAYKSLLVIGHQWPEPQATGAGLRMLWLLNGFLQEGFHIVFASAAGSRDYRADLGKLGITEVEIELNEASFDLFLRKNGFTLSLIHISEPTRLWSGSRMPSSA